MNKATRVGATVGAAAVVLLAGACGSSQQSAGTTTVQPAAAAGDAYGSGGYGSGGGSYGGDTASQAAPAAAGSAAGISTAKDAKLGDILVDGQGRTMYRYDKDTANPPTSNCNDACAQAWPPVPASARNAAKVADPSLLGEVTRADGSKQLTVAGWPMYLYAADSAAGDTNGQGVNQVWWAVQPDGKKAGQAASGSSGSSGSSGGSGGSGGYGSGGSGAGSGSASQWALSSVDDPQLGKILVDGKGMVLYRFTKDVAWPMKIACTGQCTKVWPPAQPLTLQQQEQAARALGIDRKLITNIKRPDGIYQLAINCWPVYNYSKDTKPGQASGQGVGGTWFAVTPQGKLTK
ncbi:SCO0930 family lipoprotein [Streptacidiphilus griseoplanus]|uniref:SCO0930 family lipoprotein n=1 Tax=Peterkaempfera griseoplana TaxID=66896 RepID=UPI0006E21CAA|nr:SCO0930 family lipoprotein [Peterkaempfera griseoplana]